MILIEKDYVFVTDEEIRASGEVNKVIQLILKAYADLSATLFKEMDTNTEKIELFKALFEEHALVKFENNLIKFRKDSMYH